MEYGWGKLCIIAKQSCLTSCKLDAKQYGDYQKDSVTILFPVLVFNWNSGACHCAAMKSALKAQ